MIVCICRNVSEARLKAAIKQGINSLPLLRTHLDVGTCCGRCHECTKQILQDCMQRRDTISDAPQIIYFQKLTS